MQGPAAETVNPRIRVEVETSYIEEQSDPRDKRFVFSCTITIRNEGHVPARLLTRHWIITDGTVNETPVGTMQGIYQMVAEDGEQFDAPIAPFRLARPGVLH